MRSDFEEGTTRWAVRRAQWKALGLTDEEMAKPKIAVVNSSSTLSSCYAHLDDVCSVVMAAVRDAGGLPFEVRTTAPSDFITSAGRNGRYLMPSRDLLVNDVEVMVEGAVLDGMVCLSSCDKTTPAHLMAAVRLDLPTVIVVCGYQPSGRCGDRRVDIDDVYESIGTYARGAITLSELCALTDVAIGGPGVCAGMGTANSMHIVAEALGMTPSGSAPVLAGSERMLRNAERAGRLVVDAVAAGMRPRQVVTAAAVHNAVTVAMAAGASVNVVRHLAAIAREADLDVDVVKLFEEVGGRVPLLCGVRPNGDARIEELEHSGGAQALMAQLRPLLHLGALTVDGRALAELLPEAPAGGSGVVRPLSAPCSPVGGLLILRGSLAPHGSIVKASAVAEGLTTFAGPARVFPTEADALEALGDGVIEPGDVVVLRGFGPRGGPGTVFAAGFVAALAGAGMHESVAVVTDGELSGLNRGITVGQVMPEAADGGPLAAVRDGDMIEIDLGQRRVDLQVDPEIVARRLADMVGSTMTAAPRGWLSIYRSVVQPIEQGATLLPRTGTGQ